MDTNDNWGGTTALVESAARVGAFAFADAQSKDAALALDVSPNAYTAMVTGTGGTTGVTLAEIYDANVGVSLSHPELVNVSARAQVDLGADIMIAGFVIGGDTPQTVLIRAVGPTLVNYGVTGVLADPQLAIFSDETQLEFNNDWDAALATTFTQLGAFPLDTASKDAALLVTLAPGAYTAQVSGVDGTTGVALVEVYAVP